MGLNETARNSKSKWASHPGASHPVWAVDSTTGLPRPFTVLNIGVNIIIRRLAVYLRAGDGVGDMLMAGIGRIMFFFLRVMVMLLKEMRIC